MMQTTLECVFFTRFAFSSGKLVQEEKNVQAAETIKPPPRLLAFSEPVRALMDLVSLPWAAPILGKAPRGDGHPVLVLPGFLADDGSTWVLRRFLRYLGYDARGWGLGRNIGERAVGRDGELLLKHLADLHQSTGKRVSVVGWSLGGFMARVIAREAPQDVRQVISMGTAFAGNPRATAPWVAKLYQKLNGTRIEDTDVQEQLAISATALPVPATSIFSKSDGITAWQNCQEPASATTDNIEVYASHSGLGMSPSVLFAIADRLALPEDGWRPFDRSGWRAIFYPSSGHQLG